MSSTWTDELFSEMSAKYVARMNELPEEERANESVEVVAEIAKEHGFTPNSFRMKLLQADLYIKKGPAKSSSESKAKGTGGARTSKATAHAELVAAFTDGGVATDDIDMAIVEKLTGKAAQHLAELVRKVTK